jgi:hypothetical protein
MQPDRHPGKAVILTAFPFFLSNRMTIRQSLMMYKITLFALLALTLTACTTVNKPADFDPRTCLDHPPTHVEGLKILKGSRTGQNIAADMHPVFCNGQVLLKNMNEAGTPIEAGTVRFQVLVEYTGEVIGAKVIESDIQSDSFLRKITDMIMDSDFAPWTREDEDTEFIYPMTFTRWWD